MRSGLRDASEWVTRLSWPFCGAGLLCRSFGLLVGSGDTYVLGSGMVNSLCMEAKPENILKQRSGQCYVSLHLDYLKGVKTMARVTSKYRLLVAAIGACFLSVPAFAQGTQSRILGTVTDQSGAVIAGALVTVMDVQRGIPRNLITDQSGE
jgi:hypothetical protein